jgi:response regulator of citrate/malate metabolism
MTSLEFNEKRAHMKMRFNRPTIDQWYLAQIAKEVRRTILKKGVSIQTKDLLIQFVQDVFKPKTEVEEAKKTDKAKSKWLTFFGINWK